MAEATIPVDLRNPGQVFACLGFMEAVEILCGPCEGSFNYRGRETSTSFALKMPGAEDPLAATIAFLAEARVIALAPTEQLLPKAQWNVTAEMRQGSIYPGALPDSPAALPIVLRAREKELPVDHWLDDTATGRDNVKFWAGAQGKPGAAFANDMLAPLRAVGANAAAQVLADPFAFEAPLTGGFRFDWRRDYIALDTGFSPNDHKSGSGQITMVGYPLVEILAAIGMQHARPQRPDRRDKLLYRYGVSNTRLPTAFVRAVLGAQSVGFPMRVFQMRLGWPGQEGQARCILNAEEENIQ
jgi:CRISPR-associated protein Csx14